MILPFKTEELLLQQIREVELWHKSFEIIEIKHPLEFSTLVSIQNQKNFELWHKEDIARDPHASDSEIASIKRSIDILNQKRNDMIEQIDHYLVNFLKSEKVIYLPDVEMNSETPGSIIDRLSINALKIFHMEEETKREDADNEHIKKTKEKLSILVEQRTDLGQCLSKLLEDLFKGEKFLKIYRQMKMYNDESLNPVLYKKRKTS